MRAPLNTSLDEGHEIENASGWRRERRLMVYLVF